MTADETLPAGGPSVDDAASVQDTPPAGAAAPNAPSALEAEATGQTSDSELERLRAELGQRVLEIEALQRQLKEQAIRDPLTGLYNRAYYRETISREFSAAARRQDAVSIAMVDVDGFKNINAEHGEAVGDKVLVELARVLTTGLRSSDLVCRYGAEEFVLVLPSASEASASARADLIREAFGALEVPTSANVAVKATISIGVSATRHAHEKIDAVLARAESALGTARESGGNQVCLGEGRQEDQDEWFQPEVGAESSEG